VSVTGIEMESKTIRTMMMTTTVGLIGKTLTRMTLMSVVI
jgi:hypothetical protein